MDDNEWHKPKWEKEEGEGEGGGEGMVEEGIGFENY